MVPIQLALYNLDLEFFALALKWNRFEGRANLMIKRFGLFNIEGYDEESIFHIICILAQDLIIYMFLSYCFDSNTNPKSTILSLNCKLKMPRSCYLGSRQSTRKLLLKEERDGMRELFIGFRRPNMCRIIS